MERVLSAFWEKYSDKILPEPNSGCWLWEGATNRAGYGSVYSAIQKRCLPTHRVAFETDRGSVPQGLHLDHLCRVRCCCNPDHLEPVTAAENSRRGADFRYRPDGDRSKCRRGHNLGTYGKTYLAASRLFIRCMECARISRRAWAATDVGRASNLAANHRYLMRRRAAAKTGGA